MASQLLQHYVKLTEFLGHALGPDYEVALHDLTDKNRSIIAIANSHVSGRELGAPLTNTALKILRDRSYESQDYLLHYRGVSAGGKTLRSSGVRRAADRPSWSSSRYTASSATEPLELWNRSGWGLRRAASSSTRDSSTWKLVSTNLSGWHRRRMSSLTAW